MKKVNILKNRIKFLSNQYLFNLNSIKCNLINVSYKNNISISKAKKQIESEKDKDFIPSLKHEDFVSNYIIVIYII